MSEPRSEPNFFESLDKVNRAMHGTNDLEQVMRDVLDATLAIFGCDRAYLLYACDPAAPSWEVPMERTVPAYPGAFERGVPVPTTTPAVLLFQQLLSDDNPVELNLSRGIDPEEEPWKAFQIKSVLTIALYPKTGKPWTFGLHQCSYARAWTLGEKKLFQEISRRLADGLTSLLVYRDLQESQRFLETIVENIPNVIFVKEAHSLRYLRINRAGEELVGIPRDALVGKSDFELLPREMAESFVAKDREVLLKKQLVDIAEETVRNAANEERVMHTKKIPILDDGGQPAYLLGISEDITEQKRLEEQLRQAQKMESIGRLAGGVAHDFNNMLSVILGNVDLALGEVTGIEVQQRLEDIRHAAERSARLTHQLLAFARKQTVIPEVLDLNATLAGMIKMLRVLIGKHMELVFRPADGLWPVRMDPSQVDQLLANLCVNARDAIADVGTIVIETKNTTVDEAYRAQHLDALLGDFVMLSVSDTGAGMDEETLSKVFEPFFTTKEAGKGTGLGLATVYGIAKQNGGFISAHSQIGVGSTFSLFFPRQQAALPRARSSEPNAAVGPGNETILLVEDEPVILTMVSRMLEKLGYRVLPVAKPSEAVQLAERLAGEIQLLITDVLMPEMNGALLASHVARRCPGIKCLYMSGFTDNVMAPHGMLSEDVFFIQKPFSMEALAKKLRELLG